jgi:excisionase family DNA binding protein
MDRLLLRVTEAAEAAGISRSLAYELVRVGSIPSVKVGRSIRVPAEALRAWVQSLITETEYAASHDNRPPTS